MSTIRKFKRLEKAYAEDFFGGTLEEVGERLRKKRKAAIKKKCITEFKNTDLETQLNLIVKICQYGDEILVTPKNKLLHIMSKDVDEYYTMHHMKNYTKIIWEVNESHII